MIFFLGLISNFESSEDFSSLDADLLLWLTLNPIKFGGYFSGEKIIISNDYNGLIEEPFIFGSFEAVIVSDTTSTFHPLRDRLRRFLMPESQ